MEEVVDLDNEFSKILARAFESQDFKCVERMMRDVNHLNIAKAVEEFYKSFYEIPIPFVQMLDRFPFQKHNILSHWCLKKFTQPEIVNDLLRTWCSVKTKIRSGNNDALRAFKAIGVPSCRYSVAPLYGISCFLLNRICFVIEANKEDVALLDKVAEKTKTPVEISVILENEYLFLISVKNVENLEKK